LSVELLGQTAATGQPLGPEKSPLLGLSVELLGQTAATGQPLGTEKSPLLGLSVELLGKAAATWVEHNACGLLLTWHIPRKSAILSFIILHNKLKLNTFLEEIIIFQPIRITIV
jgi:hypothetical protein